MIQLKNLTVKNFMSVGNATQAIDFDRQDLNLVPGDVKFESVDHIVTDQLTNIESEFYDNRLLLQIYQNL